MRVIALHFRKLFSQTRELFIRALDLFVGVREPFIGARDRGIARFIFFRIRCGVHWRFPFPSNVIRRWPVDHPAALRAVLSKEWTHDDRISDHMAIAS